MRLRVFLGLLITSMLGLMYAAAGLFSPGWHDVAAGLIVAIAGLLGLLTVEELS